MVDQPLLERRPDHVFDEPLRFGIVEPTFGLPLKLRLLDVRRQDRNEAFTDVFRVDRYALRASFLRAHVGANGFDNRAFEAVFV